MTEPAGLQDVVVGAAALSFPPASEELNIGDEVNLQEIIPDMPPSFQEVHPEAKPKAWGRKKGPLLDIESKFGYGFLNEFKADLLALKELIELGGFEADLEGTANISAVADFFVGAVLKLNVGWEILWPKLDYLYAGAGGKAELSLGAEIDAVFTITKSLEPETEEEKKDTPEVKKAKTEKKKGNAKRSLTKNPVKKPTGGKATKPGGKADKGSKFKFGEPKYYKGPVIYGIPTTFVFTLTGKCDFTLYGELKAKAVAKVAYDAMYAVEYKNGNWGTIEPGGFEKEFSWKVDKAEGGAEIYCEIGPRIDWLFANVAGPFIEAKGMLKAGAKFESVCPDPGTIEQEKDASGKISAFVDIGIKATVGFTLDLKVWSTEFSADLIEQWWTLWENSWPINFGFGVCPTTCHDGQKNGYETDQDCGGKSSIGACVPCEYGKTCKTNEDCNFSGSKVTCQGGKCGNLNCQTGKQEAYMTDVNCGALCASAGHVCELGKKCKINADCESDNCDFGKCGPQACDNGVKDWWESDVDCGGKYCKPCGHGQLCKLDKDCDGGNVCRGQTSSVQPFYYTGACVPASCDLDNWWTTNNFGQKAGMTDVMCGGVCARVINQLPIEACHYGKDNLLIDKTCGLATVKCGLNKKCEQDGDCLSNACYEGKCINLDCKDGKQQPWETGVDCGGKCPYKCKIDGGCKTSVDCEYSAPCTEVSAGQGKACSLCDKNGKHDGWEADVDCGAQCAGGKVAFELCKLGQKCGSSADCATGYPTTYQGQAIIVDGVKCAPAPGGVNKCALACFDGEWDQKTESDVDCGGKCAKKCGKDKMCVNGGDGESGGCLAGKCAGKCFNGKKDDDEGGIDCGGACASKCLKGMACSADDNCTTNQCIKGVCGLDLCKDKELSPGEADIDCGGPSCDKKCAIDAACKADKDCESGWCDGKNCVATSCVDKKISGTETDLDCGGGCKDKATCALGLKCKAGSDCTDKICAANGLCVNTTCKDLLLTADETDVDCGGVCSAKCTTAKGCKAGADCDSKYCDGKVCVGDFCSDKVLSPGEADLDCGGPCTKKCGTGAKCGNNTDCQSQQCSTKGVCVTTACDDGKISAGEADVDCGGVCGTPCLVGKQCKGGADCASLVCASVSLACVATPCLDEIKDGNETDIDCGGICTTKCALQKGCKLDGDCKSGFCDGAQCVATACETKKLDGDETGIDCGGSCAKKCDVGVGCKLDKDCGSGFCDAKANKCVATQCEDNHIDPGETDVDCGGACQKAKACALDQGCKDGADCASGICSAAGKCVKTTCDDGKLTADETGIDCGGACAQKCTAGQGCKANTDCDAGFCSAKNLCVGGACEDGKLSKDETDIDCGGPCSAKCAVGKGCKEEADCASTFCDATGGGDGKCQATACTDNKKNVNETDVDCGGPCAAKCATDKACKLDGDCQSSACAVNSQKCVANACLNEKADANETDVDCGGVCSTKCAATKGCKANGDCQTTYCDGKACVSDPCVDNQKDLDETDVDCGGSCQAKCLTGKGCALASDCSSTFCDGAVCVATSCDDKKTDFGETDVDCGKVCSAKCLKDKGCAESADCQSGLCATVSKICVVDLCKDETQTVNSDPTKSESDVDCGGPCQKCVVGKLCGKNADCASGYCDGKMCVSDHCLDKQKDVGETGVDCGGTCSQACDNGQGCALAKDCVSTYCAAVSLACVATPCADEVKNGAETDVDCGGNVCSGKCATGKLCKAGGDCKSGFCNATTGKCVATSCEDGVKSGDELGEDCGGSCGSGCKDGSTCTKDADCLANVCVSHTGNGGQKLCGCPQYHIASKVKAAGKSVVCAQNYVYQNGCYDAGGGVIQCQPYQFISTPYGMNTGLNSDFMFAVCDDQTQGGKDDWRVPTFPEMVSVMPFKEQSMSVPAKPDGPFGELWYPPKNAEVPAIMTSTRISPPFPGYQNNMGTMQPNSLMVIDPWGWTMFNVTAPTWTNKQAVFPGGYSNPANAGVYCVRRHYDFPPALPNPRFELIYGGQVVKDHGLGKQWYRTKYYKAPNYLTAKSYCDGVNVAGQTGWRVPTIHEIMGIIDFGKKTPPYWDTDLFPAVEQPGGSNGYSGESFFTSNNLCNTATGGTDPCRYQFNPYDLNSRQAQIMSVLCVR